MPGLHRKHFVLDTKVKPIKFIMSVRALAYNVSLAAVKLSYKTAPGISITFFSLNFRISLFLFHFLTFFLNYYICLGRVGRCWYLIRRSQKGKGKISSIIQFDFVPVNSKELSDLPIRRISILVKTVWLESLSKIFSAQQLWGICKNPSKNQIQIPR